MPTTLRSGAIAFALTIAVGLTIRLVACAPDATTSNSPAGDIDHADHADSPASSAHDSTAHGNVDHSNHTANKHVGHADNGAAPDGTTTNASPAGSPSPRSDLVALGNAKCPVMGGTVDRNGFEYNGWWIGQCCPGCEETFKASPEAYVGGLIEQTGKDVRVPPTEAEDHNTAHPRKFERGPEGTWRLGNALCPVMEHEARDDVGFAYNGWWINICCAGCDAKFNAAPDDYAPTLAEWTGVDVRKSPIEYGVEAEAGE